MGRNKVKAYVSSVSARPKQIEIIKNKIVIARGPLAYDDKMGLQAMAVALSLSHDQIIKSSNRQSSNAIH